MLVFIGRSQHIGWGMYILLVSIFFAVQFYGCYFINSGFHIKAYCEKKTDKKEIAITFDDGPDNTLTPKILNILREFYAPAAFFCIGKKIKGNESLLVQMYKENHIVGNHSDSHAMWFDLFSAERMTKDISEAGKKIHAVIGMQPKFFRPPYGVTNPNLRRAVSRLKYLTMGWNLRSLDTALKDEEKIFRRITGKIKPGSVILLHDTIKETEIMLPKLLFWLRENQYKVVRMDELFNLTAYEKA